MDTKILNLNDLRKILSCIERTKVNDNRVLTESQFVPKEVTSDLDIDNDELDRLQTEIRAQESKKLDNQHLTKDKIIAAFSKYINELKQVDIEYEKGYILAEREQAEDVKAVDKKMVQGLKIVIECFNKIADAAGLPKIQANIYLPFYKDGRYQVIDPDGNLSDNIEISIKTLRKTMQHTLDVVKS